MKSRSVIRWMLFLFFILLIAPMKRIAVAEDFCLEIHKHDTVGLLDPETGLYVEHPGMSESLLSPDGRYTLHTLTQEYHQEVRIRSNDIGAVITLGLDYATISSYSAIWSPDNRYLAFSGWHYEGGHIVEVLVSILDVEIGEVISKTYQDVEFTTLGTWSDDSQYFYFSLSADLSATQTIYYFLHIGDWQVMPFPIQDMTITVPEWLPKGHQLAVLQTSSTPQVLSLIEPEAGMLKSVALPTEVLYPSVIHSPNGDYLGVYGNIHCDQNGNPCSYGAVIMGRDGSVPTVIEGSGYHSAEWAADWSGDDRTWLFLQPSQTPPEIPLERYLTSKDLKAYFPAEGRIEVIQEHVIVPSSIEAAPGTNTPGISVNYFKQNRFFMVYQSQGKLNVAVSDADGENRQVVVSGADSLAPYHSVGANFPCTACQSRFVSLPNPTWIENSLLVQWSKGGHDFLGWLLVDGSGWYEITDWKPSSDMVMISRIPHIVSSSKGGNSLEVLDLETGQATVLFQGTKEQPLGSWYVVPSPDGQRGILHLNSGKQYLFSFDQPELNEIGPGSAYMAGPSWSPDSSHIAFLQANINDSGAVEAEIVAVADGTRIVWPVGRSEFMFPREFSSRSDYLQWTACSASK